MLKQAGLLMQCTLFSAQIIACFPGLVTEPLLVQGLWEAAESILNTIVLPPAIDDAGGAGSKNYDYTQVSLLLH